jgi:hypothetical protein
MQAGIAHESCFKKTLILIAELRSVDQVLCSVPSE